MNGRGIVYQRSGNGGDNSRYIPMKNMMQNVDGVQVLVDDNIGSRNDKGKCVSKNNDGLKKQAMKHNVIKIKNSFNVAESEKKRWSEDLRKYYDDRCADKAKVNLIEGLKWRISKLQKDISYGHNNVAMFANIKANKSCKKIMQETGMTHNQAYFKTEEMNAKYEGMVSEKVDDMIKKQFDENMIECMNDEVAEETHGSVMFVTQDMASNVAGRYDMFILAKKLKSMKKHLKGLNKKNENIFDKVRFLKTELERVQSSLDRDPLNANLREEEIAFFHNMVKGKISKNRIDEVKDEQGNTFTGCDVATKFVDHFKSFFSSSDYIYPIEDPSNMFTRRLEPEVARDLIRPIFDEENKAAWRVVGKDTCGAVKEFFINGKLLGEFNTTLISLIPKIKTPIKVSDYSPISCCNVVYKTISKVITNRLKMVLNDLVDVNQSAFIPGRQISDNILLTQEFIRGYGWNWGARRCEFKIDIQKAYDTVNWSLLDFVLKELGFHLVMVHWIMVCLTTAYFSVYINAETHGFFKTGRGLRQGDPISPYLFYIGNGNYEFDDQETSES
ncbi:RNA-directed DNA polymerase, eukaryota, reverse transcriptase zinc-binding domain protein [Tanacetum coccineum]